MKQFDMTNYFEAMKLFKQISKKQGDSYVGGAKN